MLQAEVRIPQSLARHTRTCVVSSSAAGLRACGYLPADTHRRMFPVRPNEDSAVTSVDCNQPHDGEYFHIFDFAGTSLPSDDEMDEESDEICGLIFEHYVGKPVADSTLDYDWTFPLSQTWAKGDHTVQCYLFAKDDSKLTGSARNSNM